MERVSRRPRKSLLYLCCSFLAFLLLLGIGTVPNAHADTITVDEAGHGTFNGQDFWGTLGPDPTQGLAGNVLIYNLPFLGVEGDVLMYDNNDINDIGDVLRFDGVGHLIFYSQNDSFPTDAPADTGLPSLIFLNNVSIPELPQPFIEGYNYSQWTPVAGQPGFDPGSPGVPSFNPDYTFISDTPEPATMLLFGVGLAGFIGLKLRRKS